MLGRDEVWREREEGWSSLLIMEVASPPVTRWVGLTTPPSLASIRSKSIRAALISSLIEERASDLGRLVVSMNTCSLACSTNLLKH